MPSAGRILIIPRGEWNENIIYEALDLVNRNGYAYLAKKTSQGIEPSDEHSEYWHNMLNIQKIVENKIADTVGDDVGNILSERFRNEMSEALYVTNLMADYTEATFVQWNADTENTPYKAALTEGTEGFALVFGTVANNHTIIAWSIGGEKPDIFTHYISDGNNRGWNVYGSEILGIEKGGTGAETAQEALENLGIPEYVENYQKPWNVDENVGIISNTTSFEKVFSEDIATFQSASISIPMINSGEVYLCCSWYATSSSSNIISSDFSLSIYCNDTLVTTRTDVPTQLNTDQVLLTVNKGDIVRLVVSGTRIDEYNNWTIHISNIHLKSNIDTPYKYLSF